MVCHYLDVQPDSKLGIFLANKSVSIVVAIVQLMLWVIGLSGLLFKPGVTSNLHTAEVVITHILILICIGFSALLLVGLFKDRNYYLKLYLIFIVTIIVISVIMVLVKLFTPRQSGVWGILSAFIGTFINLLFFFVIRNYYIMSQMSGPGNVNGA